MVGVNIKLLTCLYASDLSSLRRSHIGSVCTNEEQMEKSWLVKYLILLQHTVVCCSSIRYFTSQLFSILFMTLLMYIYKIAALAVMFSRLSNREV